MEYTGKYIIIGPPGTGKTTFLAKQVDRVVDYGYKPLVCSLTNTAAKEIASRDMPIPENMVGTLHSLAYNNNEYRKPVVDIKLWNEENPNCTIDDNESSEDVIVCRGQKIMNQYDLLRHKCIDKKFWPPHVIEFAKKWEDWKEETQTIDFTDMIEQALTTDKVPGNADIVIGDELQDFSLLEFNLLNHWGGLAESMMGCGDGWQSLYEWRGADPSLLEGQRVDGGRIRVLGQSWRVPRAVHGAAIKWVSQLSTYSPIEYLPRPADGEVSRLDSTTENTTACMDLVKQSISDGKTIMIMASCGYMLTSIIAAMRKVGIPFANPWRTRNGAWNPLGHKSGTSTVSRVLSLLKMIDPAAGVWTADEFYYWASILPANSIFKAKMKGVAEKKYKEMTDTEKTQPWYGVFRDFIEVDKISGVAGLLKAADGVGAVRWWLNLLADNKKRVAEYLLNIVEGNGIGGLRKQPSVFIGTIHSFKGAEADRVVVFPDLSFSAYQEWYRGGKNRDSIIRAFYVAMTRARESLYLCKPAGSNTVIF